ncbi:MAG: ribose-phosphate pyrophosphokinase [Candidatus Diapherotrites archaeon]|jgi:ribose-phosphate pyrophosphokinase|uniref:ribose-phosphate diphosphokinase n=1 Tax=Candidatus Iainarchaeum sp. TaxID=3101447 RepID=A0A8T5GFX5_9ARCH|nr:ribose-phosphate pyrophosphokinase [Candidatus Diapherotrites archaeon]MBT7240865.1 ribose-phosphate pyrophosphokinase [Candidatus Diapherotrites archaeon]
MQQLDELKLFIGSSNPLLGEEICEQLNIESGKMEIKKFASGETYVRFLENIRAKDVFLIQTAVEPINDNLMELLIMIDAAKRASAGRITVVMPHFFYARQDRKAASREPITAKLTADLLEKAGASRIITLEVHSDQIPGFFDIPFDNLAPKKVFVKKAQELCEGDCVVVAPDAGAAKKSTKISKTLDSGLAIINKVRSKHNHAEAMNIIGDDVNGKNCLIFDDIVDTGGSLCAAANLVKAQGANKVYAFITHGLFNGDAIEKIEKSDIDIIFTTNTVPQNKKCKKLEIISIADYFAKSIKSIHENESVSKLF